MNEKGLSSQVVIYITLLASIVQQKNIRYQVNKILNISNAFAGLDLLAYHYINPGYPVDMYGKAKGMC
jgi:hypothetical protein